jgi:hypothetical protein
LKQSKIMEKEATRCLPDQPLNWPSVLHNGICIK